MEQITQPLPFEPFKERVVGLRQRLLDAQVILDSIVVGADLQQSHKVDDQRRSRIAEAFGLDDGGAVTAQARRMAWKVAGIKSQLSAGAIMVEATLRELDEAMKRAQETIDRRDYIAGVTAIGTLQTQLEDGCVRPLEELKILMQQRLGEDGFREVEVIDLMISTLYGAVAERAVRERLVAADSMPLTPVCWIPSYERRLNGGPLATHSVVSPGLPLALLPIEDAVLSQPWRHVLAYRHIAAQLYRDLMLDQEVSAIVARAAPYLSSNTMSLFSAARIEIVAEAMAVLLAGPAYVGALIERLAHRADVVASGGSAGGLLPAYVRWMIACAVLELAGFRQEAYTYRNAIERFYGPPEFVARVPVPQPTVAELASVAPALVGAVLAQPLRALQGRALPQFLPVLDQNRWRQVQEQAEELSGTGQPNPERRPKTAPRREKEKDEAPEGQRKQPNEQQESAVSEIREATSADLSTTVPTVILAARVAFERASADGKDLQTLSQSLRRAIRSFAEGYYRGPEGRQTQREFNEDDVKRLVRQRAPSITADRFGGGANFSPCDFELAVTQPGSGIGYEATIASLVTRLGRAIYRGDGEEAETRGACRVSYKTISAGLLPSRSVNGRDHNEGSYSKCMATRSAACRLNFRIERKYGIGWAPTESF